MTFDGTYPNHLTVADFTDKAKTRPKAEKEAVVLTATAAQPVWEESLALYNEETDRG